MMYEGLLHIPMIVKFPGADHPRGESRSPVQLVDVLPTIVATTGAVLPAGVQGEPLQAVDHAVLAEEHINPEFVSQYGAVYNRALRALYDGDYKLITTSRGQRFLFDLAHDRDEERNLASKEPERVAKMEETLEAAMSGMDPKVASIDPATIPGVRAGDVLGEHYR
jgi:arylsulfatase A-like enzyme